ncbi:MAG TPA: nicotinate-nucleotide--dimethylbenzimidazole phosphoribosyltransferase, partial [Methylomirabilota bacterium]|nr:nicotinate-nucleotide--dimethylbenzimidazole phosphoribosyltransferase [Methylomirabilota bacterium]
MTTLERLVTSVTAPDESLAVAARRRLDSLTKPRGSLGRLEELAVRVVVITGDTMPRVDAPVIFTLAGDHGVATEGVSAYPQAVTAQMVENLARGGAGVNVLARQVGARVVVGNLGVAAPLADHAAIVDRSVAPG